MATEAREAISRIVASLILTLVIWRLIDNQRPEKLDSWSGLADVTLYLWAAMIGLLIYAFTTVTHTWPKIGLAWDITKNVPFIPLFLAGMLLGWLIPTVVRIACWTLASTLLTPRVIHVEHRKTQRLRARVK